MFFAFAFVFYFPTGQKQYEAQTGRADPEMPLCLCCLISLCCKPFSRSLNICFGMSVFACSAAKLMQFLAYTYTLAVSFSAEVSFLLLLFFFLLLCLKTLL